MIRLQVDESKLNEIDYLKELVYKLCYLKLYRNNKEELFDYYKGLRPNVPTTKDDYTPKVFNFAKPITDIATKVFIGELPDIVTSGKKTEKDKISNFNQLIEKASLKTKLFTVGKHASISGSGFLNVFNEYGDIFPKFAYLNPQFTDVVYDCTIAMKPVLAFTIIQTEKLGQTGIAQENYTIFVYTKDKIFSFESVGRTFGNPAEAVVNKDFIAPISGFIVNGNGSYVMEHNFNDIPIIEFPNNEEYKGDFECVIPLFDGYNELQNNRLENVDDVVQYMLLVKNARFGNEEETKDAVKMIKENHILAIEGDNTDAKFLTNPLDQQHMQIISNDIKQAIHYISRVPDLSSIDFSQNASDPILKIKTKPLMDLCNEKELSFTPSFRKLISIVLGFCEKYDTENYDKYNFDLDLCSLEYAHDLPSNDTDMITQIVNLANSGTLNPEVALQRISWIKNPHTYIKGMNEWNKIIDKRKKSNENDNIEKQNSTPVTKDDYDNQVNATIRDSQKLSQNKV